MNRRFRMISLMSEALSLELEDVLERDANYEKSFRKEFSDEIRFLMHQEDLRHRSAPPPVIDLNLNDEIIPTNKEERTGVVKDIYRSLAKHTHPDIAGPESEEEFKEIQNAYSAGDLVGLLAAANRRGVAPELDDKDLDDLQDMLDRQRSSIDEVKQTVRWQWGTSEQTEELRANIRQALGIHPLAFYNWKEERTAQERKIAQARAEKERRRREKIEKAKRAERKRQVRKAAARGARNHSRARDLERARKKSVQK